MNRKEKGTGLSILLLPTFTAITSGSLPLVGLHLGAGHSAGLPPEKALVATPSLKGTP